MAIGLNFSPSTVIPFLSLSNISGVGKPFIALALFFFSFTTILAYYYIAETNVASVAIYDQMMLGEFETVHQYALILLGVSFILIFFLNLLTRKTTRSNIA
jgi:ABC-type sulfate transport system permease component